MDKLEVVRNLLSKAESTTVEAEAETFRAKATEMITKYQLDEAAVYAASKTQRDIISKFIKLEGSYRAEKFHLITQMGTVFGCSLVGHSVPGGRGIHYVTLYGTESAIQLTELYVTSVMAQAANMIEYAPIRPARIGWPITKGDTRQCRQAWLFGFYMKCTSRLKDHFTDVSHETSNEGAALVLMSDFERAQKELKKNHTKLKTMEAFDYRSRPLSLRGGFDDGERAVLGNRNGLSSAESMKQLS